MWMYDRTSLFPRGITMTLPELAEWIAHPTRRSARENQPEEATSIVMGMMSSTPLR